jgi:hypothetical protein
MVPADEAVSLLVAPGEPELAGLLVVVAPPREEVEPARLAQAVDRLATLPCVLVGRPGWDPTGAWGELLDAQLASSSEADEVAERYRSQPYATLAAALHLRGAARRTTADGLVAESALYSTLQSAPEHRRWRELTPVRVRTDDADQRVRIERVGGELTITLSRPRVRNALDRAMRDQLLDALAVAEADSSLQVVLRGEGPTFCSGGDLDEFGTHPGPVEAHAIRLRRSIGAALHRLATRTTVVVHGPCAGSGVELPAFAGRVIAHPDTTFELPELAMGLIPGAGGTVSLPARIGRHRTAALVLTGRRIDAATALAWGLIDEIALI